MRLQSFVLPACFDRSLARVVSAAQAAAPPHLPLVPPRVPPPGQRAESGRCRPGHLSLRRVPALLRWPGGGGERRGADLDVPLQLPIRATPPPRLRLGGAQDRDPLPRRPLDPLWHVRVAAVDFEGHRAQHRGGYGRGQGVTLATPQVPKIRNSLRFRDRRSGRNASDEGLVTEKKGCGSRQVAPRPRADCVSAGPALRQGGGTQPGGGRANSYKRLERARRKAAGD